MLEVGCNIVFGVGYVNIINQNECTNCTCITRSGLGNTAINCRKFVTILKSIFDLNGENIYLRRRNYMDV